MGSSGCTRVSSCSTPWWLVRWPRSLGLRTDDIAWLIGFLTRREREVLRRIVIGQSTDEMAKDMRVSRSTARTHVQNVLQKLGVHSRLQAVAAVSRRQPGDLDWLSSTSA